MSVTSLRSPTMEQRIGSARIEPEGSFEAGSFGSFTLTYTAGYFGIDDTGTIKIVMRMATDGGRLQFTQPEAPNYCTVEASNGAVLDVRYELKLNVRPWDRTLFIRVVRGFFVANRGIGVAIDLDQHELRAVGGVANHVEACDPGLPDAVAGIFERGGDEGIFGSGFNLNMNLNYMHIVSMMPYWP